MNNFLKQVFSSCLGTLLALGTLSILSLSAFIALIALFSSQDSAIKPKAKTVLVIDTGFIIQDRDPSRGLEDAFAGGLPNVVSLRDVTTAIRAAAQDESITGIFLDGRQDSLNGYASLREVRQALKEFKEAGKKIFAYDVGMSEREYYLASLADEIWLNPMGGMEINGLGAEQLFLTGALEKYGIGVQIVRVGSFKSAVEPFTRSDFSPENRQQVQGLLTDVWTEFKQTTSGDRQLNATTLQDLANTQGIIPPDTAQSAKLVDRLMYFDEVLDELKQFTGVKSDEIFSQVSLNDYRDKLALKEVGTTAKNKIALVYAEGNIVDGEGSPDAIGGDSFSLELRQIREDEDVKAVVLRINSPGGSAIASDIILRELKLIREQAKKPVIVSMGDVAASGGYWIATESDYIFAQNNTITGSIGVFGILPNIQEIGNNNGLTWDVVKTGDLANIATASRPKTEQELAIFQEFVNEIYDDFLERVSNARGLSKAEVDQIAQGRIWSGEDAKSIKLVDEIGGLKEAIAYAASQANLGEDYQVQEYPVPTKWEDELLKNLFGTGLQTSVDPVSEEWLRLKDGLEMWRSLNDPKHVYALFPWQMHLE